MMQAAAWPPPHPQPEARPTGVQANVRGYPLASVRNEATPLQASGACPQWDTPTQSLLTPPVGNALSVRPLPQQSETEHSRSLRSKLYGPQVFFFSQVISLTCSFDPEPLKWGSLILFVFFFLIFVKCLCVYAVVLLTEPHRSKMTSDRKAGHCPGVGWRRRPRSLWQGICFGH